MYCQAADLVARFSEEEMIQLTDHDNQGFINTTVLGQALSDAAAEINGYLQGRYRLPLANPPMVLKRIACDIARYYLYDDKPIEQVRTRYEDAVKFLMAVAKGQVSLGLNEDDAAVKDSQDYAALGFTSRNDWQGRHF